MRFTTASAVLAASLAPVSATIGSVFPLYVYPSKVYNDGAAQWQTSIKAIKASPQNPWLVILNADSGPGNNTLTNDVNWVSGASQLNALPNVKTIGYVHTNYSQIDIAKVKANITTWATWANYKGNDTSIKGIFFDESSQSNPAYLREATSFAKKAFKNGVTTVCNFGVKTSNELYDVCDVVVAFESCLNCKDDHGNQYPQYKSGATIDANVVKDREEQASIIVKEFHGNAADGRPASVNVLNEYVQVANDKGVGYVYFTGLEYNNTDAGVINIGDLSRALVAADN